jgi:hypothetical protein
MSFQKKTIVNLLLNKNIHESGNYAVDLSKTPYHF